MDNLGDVSISISDLGFPKIALKFARLSLIAPKNPVLTGQNFSGVERGLYLVAVKREPANIVRAVAVAQLAERSLPIPEIPSSDPIRHLKE